jgi:hypothetical protein
MDVLRKPTFRRPEPMGISGGRSKACRFRNPSPSAVAPGPVPFGLRATRTPFALLTGRAVGINGRIRLTAPRFVGLDEAVRQGALSPFIDPEHLAGHRLSIHGSFDQHRRDDARVPQTGDDRGWEITLAGVGCRIVGEEQ